MDIASSISGAAKNLTDQLRDIASPIAVLALVVLGIMWIFSSDPQSLKKIKTWFFCVAAGTALIWMAGPIVDFFKSVGEKAAESANQTGAIIETFKHWL